MTNWRTAQVALLALIALSLAGCQRGMYDQPRYEPLEESDFGPFHNNQSSRHLVQGTVARGQLRIDDHFYTGKVNEQFVTEFPMQVDNELMQHGHERYNIYCSMCHGYDGHGDGMVVRRGFKRPPSLHEQRLRDAAHGHFFDVISRGFGVMPSYSGQIPVADRWAIVAYVRALQRSRNLTAEETAALPPPDPETLKPSNSTGRTPPQDTPPQEPQADASGNEAPSQALPSEEAR